jgi:hypothetical protein
VEESHRWFKFPVILCFRGNNRKSLMKSEIISEQGHSSRWKTMIKRIIQKGNTVKLQLVKYSHPEVTQEVTVVKFSWLKTVTSNLSHKTEHLMASFITIKLSFSFSNQAWWTYMDKGTTLQCYTAWFQLICTIRTQARSKLHQGITRQVQLTRSKRTLWFKDLIRGRYLLSSRIMDTWLELSIILNSRTFFLNQMRIT